MQRLKGGSRELRKKANQPFQPQLVTANGTALDKTKGTILLNGGAGLTGLTLAAPLITDLGVEVTITNIAAQTAALVVSGMAFATQDTFSFAAAAAAVIGPSVTLRCVNTAAVGAAATPRWIVVGAAGFVAGTTAVA